MTLFLTQKEINADILDAVADLANAHGYQKSKSDGGSLRKKTKDVWTSLGFGILDFGEVKTIIGFSAAICFPSFELISHPFLKEHSLMGGKTNEFRASFFPPNVKFKNEIPERFEITQLSQLADIKSRFRRFIVEDALPHFQEWGHLEKMYNLASLHKDRETLSSIFGTNWEFQKAILLRMFDDPNYEVFIGEFCAKRKEIFDTYPDEIVAVQYHKAAIALRKRLSELL